MKRWMAWIALAVCVVLLALLLTSCSSGDGTEPSPVPRVGRYAYSFQAEGLTASGTMHLDWVSPDSIAGRFEVPGWETTFQGGGFNLTGWLVDAMPLQGGIAQQRLILQGEELSCTRARYYVSANDIRFASCETVYQGP